MSIDQHTPDLVAENMALKSENEWLKQQLFEAHRTIRYERHKKELNPFDLMHLRDDDAGCFEDAEQETE